jgi:hypothetical protein
MLITARFVVVLVAAVLFAVGAALPLYRGRVVPAGLCFLAVGLLL